MLFQDISFIYVAHTLSCALIFRKFLAKSKGMLLTHYEI